jgi:PPIC-type PPIASE domain
MRRTVLNGAWLVAVVVVGSLAGCSGFRDLFSAHADVAAVAGNQQLSAQRLGQILTGGKGLKTTREAASFVANMWIDYALFAQAAVDNKLPIDSASIAQAVWPELAEMKGSHWHDTLMARRSVVSPKAADSLYEGDQVRVLQHILFKVEPNAVPEARNGVRKKAEGTLARLKKGADFSQLASQLSEDPGSRADRGFLPPSPKGKFVTSFDSAGWTLAPGGMSGIVESPFGYHIIKRPSEDAVRDRLTSYLAQSAGMRLDSIYMDSLALTRNIKVAKGAAKEMREASKDPDAARRSKKTLVTFKGGELTVAEFMRWVQALPPQYSAQLRQADDSMLTKFAKILSQNLLLLRQADSAKIQVTPAEWKSLAENYRGQLDTLRIEMGLASADLKDSTGAKGERDKLAALKLEQYFDGLINGNTRLRPLPSALATLLRERSTYRVYEAGLNRAIEIAEAERRKSDSTNAKAGPLKRAPGPAPIPGVGPGPRDSAGKGAAPKGNTAPKGTAAPKSPPAARGDSAGVKTKK